MISKDAPHGLDELLSAHRPPDAMLIRANLDTLSDGAMVALIDSHPNGERALRRLNQDSAIDSLAADAERALWDQRNDGERFDGMG